QHAVDFSAGARIRFATRFGALRRRWNAAAAAHAWRLTHQHARFRHLPEPSLAARCPPVLPLEIEQRRRHAAEMREMGDSIIQAGLNDGIAHLDRKSTRLNSSHDQISYAVSCLKKTTD